MVCGLQQLDCCVHVARNIKVTSTLLARTVGSQAFSRWTWTRKREHHMRRYVEPRISVAPLQQQLSRLKQQSVLACGVHVALSVIPSCNALWHVVTSTPTRAIESHMLELPWPSPRSVVPEGQTQRSGQHSVQKRQHLRHRIRDMQEQDAVQNSIRVKRSDASAWQEQAPVQDDQNGVDEWMGICRNSSEQRRKNAFNICSRF